MKIIYQCWSCNKEYDVSNWKPMLKDIKCECGGYIISPSGKVKMKLIDGEVKK